MLVKIVEAHRQGRVSEDWPSRVGGMDLRRKGTVISLVFPEEELLEQEASFWVVSDMVTTQ